MLGHIQTYTDLCGEVSAYSQPLHLGAQSSRQTGPQFSVRLALTMVCCGTLAHRERSRTLLEPATLNGGSGWGLRS